MTYILMATTSQVSPYQVHDSAARLDIVTAIAHSSTPVTLGLGGIETCLACNRGSTQGSNNRPHLAHDARVVVHREEPQTRKKGVVGGSTP